MHALVEGRPRPPAGRRPGSRPLVRRGPSDPPQVLRKSYGPLAPSRSPRRAAYARGVTDTSAPPAARILVVDDDPTVAEVVAGALDDLGPASRDVVVDIPDSLPEVEADPGILERVIVNLTGNALRYSPPGKPPLLAASALGDRVELRVVDRGPGIPPDDRDRVFVPFQRLGDTDNTSGVGLGLALSRGLTEVMDGTLEPEETPGGGLTMIISLPAAAVADPQATAPGRRERDETAGAH